MRVKEAGIGHCSKSLGREWEFLNRFREALNQTLSEKMRPGQLKAETPPHISSGFPFDTAQASPAFPCEWSRDEMLRLHLLSPFCVSLLLRNLVFAEHHLPWGTG